MTQPYRPLAAALWMLLAIVAFMSMAVAGRAVAPAHDTFEIMLYRSLIGVAVVLAVGGWAGTLHQIGLRRMRLHLTRNVAHFAGQNLWFYALTVIPLAQVFALEFTTPVWVILLSPLMLGEKLTGKGALAAALGFVGILIVARPDPANLSPGLIAAALCAVGFALSAILTKQLTRVEPMTVILFWLTVMQAVFALGLAGRDGDIALPDATSGPWLLLIGLAGMVAHFALTRALSLAPATVAMPVDFLRLPAIAVLGWLVYDEAVDGYLVIGAALILVANAINLKRTRAG
ncbi:MAG: DMT family transporter [Rhodobacterales bacterium]|nr:DMT family transporter [Rhodobacterales bacterium]NCT12134.1 DMT family transporter [Rhodobacterales bacterium]